MTRPGRAEERPAARTSPTPGQGSRDRSARTGTPFPWPCSTPGAPVRDNGSDGGQVAAGSQPGQVACQLSDRERFIRAQRSFEAHWHDYLAAVLRGDVLLAAELRAGLAEHHGLRIPAPPTAGGRER